MNKKIVVALITIAWLVLGIVSISYGGAGDLLDTGTPTIYKVAIAKFELSTDGGSTYTTIFESTSDYIDIASVSGGQKAGNFTSGLSVPDGTYTHVRVTPSITFKMKGSAVDTNTYYTTTGTTDVGGNIGSTGLTTADDLAEGTMIINDGTIIATTNALSPNITVKNGVANHTVRVSFDVSDTLKLYDSDGVGGRAFFPSVPSVTITVQ